VASTDRRGPIWKAAALAVLAATLVLGGCAKGRKKPVVTPAPPPAAPAAPQASALELALAEFYHTPYRSGGTTQAGVDCSGFVQAAFQRAGLALPRTVIQQYQAGHSVPKAQLRFGDVVFFNRYCQVWKAGPYLANLLSTGEIDRICHNGIYLGDGRFMHASPRGVEISNINEDVWRAAFIGARRFFPGQAP
jgi:cell wall-associated NlpC family hydrolase